MPAVRGRTLSSFGSFLVPVSLGGSIFVAVPIAALPAKRGTHQAVASKRGTHAGPGGQRGTHANPTGKRGTL